ncbi:MAG: hypothetical protein KDJ39_18730 [Gammaproteobacteria bacterium]|nr:hypothetical protein [Gammaproteobacteria bacterium]
MTNATHASPIPFCLCPTSPRNRGVGLLYSGLSTLPTSEESQAVVTGGALEEIPMRLLNSAFSWILAPLLISLPAPASASIAPICDLLEVFLNAESCVEKIAAPIRAESKRTDDLSMEAIQLLEEMLETASPERADDIRKEIAKTRHHIEVNDEFEEALIRFDLLLLHDYYNVSDTPPEDDDPLERFLFVTACNGDFPTARGGAGDTCLLTFRTVELATLLQVAGPEVFGVHYEVNLDPTTPDLFVPIGTSYDTASDFAMLFEIDGFEPLIRASPFDAAGNPVALTRRDGVFLSSASVILFDLPLDVPEPMTFWLLAAGLMSLTGQMRVRARGNPHATGLRLSPNTTSDIRPERPGMPDSPRRMGSG